MGLVHSPKIITNGLVLALDAGNPKSYPGSGTDWNDLTPNAYNSFVLVNGATYTNTANGCINLDGTNQYAALNTGTGISSLPNATFVSWIYRNGSQIGWAGILFSRPSATTGMNLYSNGTMLGYHWNDASNTWSWVSGLTVPDQQWCMAAISVASSSATAYIFSQSGVSSSTNNVSHGSTSMNTIYIGYQLYSNRFFKGNIATSLVYNRALTQDELTQNFQSLRKRFGL